MSPTHGLPLSSVFGLREAVTIKPVTGSESALLTWFSHELSVCAVPKV